MKYKIIEWLFGWMNTRLIDLTPWNIITMITEFVIVCCVVSVISKVITDKE